MQYGTRLIRDHIWVPQWIFIGIRLCLDYTCSSEILTPATYKSRIVGQKSDSLKQYKWKLVIKTWRTFSPLKSLTRWVAHLMHLVHCFIREGSGYQIRWIFGKIPNGFPPPPSFLENCIANFLWQIWQHICEEIWWPDSMKCMHMISRYRCNTIVIQCNYWK